MVNTYWFQSPLCPSGSLLGEISAYIGYSTCAECAWVQLLYHCNGPRCVVVGTCGAQ